jgi:hypothetical protein
MAENWRRAPRHPHARRTHCVHGHPFDEVNTYRAPDGSRHCRACNLQSVRSYQAKTTRTIARDR